MIGSPLVQLGVIYALILTGMALKLLVKDVSTLTRMLSPLLINLLTPMMIFTSVTQFCEAFDYKIALFSASIFFLSIVVAFLFFKVLKQGRDLVGPFVLTSINPNGFYFPIPIIYALYGVDGVSYSTVYLLVANLVNAFLIFPLYSYYSSNDQRKKTSLLSRILLFPPFIASIFGFIFLSLSWRLPQQLIQPASYLGQLTTYLALFYVGLNISLEKGSWLSRSVFGVAAIRLLILPLMIFGLMKTLGLKEIWSAIIIIHSGMPPAVNNIILADYFGLHKKLVAKIVTVVTVLTLFTLPLLIYLGQSARA